MKLFFTVTVSGKVNCEVGINEFDGNCYTCDSMLWRCELKGTNGEERFSQAYICPHCNRLLYDSLYLSDNQSGPFFTGGEVEEMLKPVAPDIISNIRLYEREMAIKGVVRDLRIDETPDFGNSIGQLEL